jgi:hypothetical protein
MNTPQLSGDRVARFCAGVFEEEVEEEVPSLGWGVSLLRHRVISQNIVLFETKLFTNHLIDNNSNIEYHLDTLINLISLFRFIIDLNNGPITHYTPFFELIDAAGNRRGSYYLHWPWKLQVLYNS